MYRFFLATPEKVVFDDLVISLIAPGTVGYFEVLTNHAAIISSLKPGHLIVTDKDKKKWVWAVSGGYFEMSHNEATLLADAAELSSEIDKARAEESLKKAQKRIEADGSEVDVLRAKKSLAKAKNRLKVATDKSL